MKYARLNSTGDHLICPETVAGSFRADYWHKVSTFSLILLEHYIWLRFGMTMIHYAGALLIYANRHTSSLLLPMRSSATTMLTWLWTMYHITEQPLNKLCSIEVGSSTRQFLSCLWIFTAITINVSPTTHKMRYGIDKTLSLILLKHHIWFWCECHRYPVTCYRELLWRLVWSCRSITCDLGEAQQDCHRHPMTCCHV